MVKATLATTCKCMVFSEIIMQLCIILFLLCKKIHLFRETDNTCYSHDKKQNDPSFLLVIIIEVFLIHVGVDHFFIAF